jgi:hypothetical protein
MAIVADFKDTQGLWVKSYSCGGSRFWTSSCSVWTNMNTRCKEGGAYQSKNPTYLGCRVGGVFIDFQTFTEWYTSQVGYGSGYQLDKDILLKGNKVYNEDSCVLVPKDLNMFLTSRGNARGVYPQGVTIQKTTGRFLAQVHVDGKTTHVGIYDSPYTAAVGYKYAKEAEAHRWYERLIAGEFLVDERVIEHLRTWKMEAECRS